MIITIIFFTLEGDPVNNIDPDGNKAKWLQSAWKGTKEVAKGAYNLYIGDDIKTLRSKKSNWYQKAWAGVSIASNFVPGLGQGKLLVKGSIKAAKAVKTAKRVKLVGGSLKNQKKIKVTTAQLKNIKKKVNVSQKKSAGNVAKPSKGTGNYQVGPYKDIKGVKGLDEHHVGQKALMKDLVENYDMNTAPAINVPKVGHTRRGPNGIVSRNTEGIDNTRQLLARDIKELRRVYGDIPNSALKEFIELNKKMYPEMRK